MQCRRLESIWMLFENNMRCINKSAGRLPKKVNAGARPCIVDGSEGNYQQLCQRVPSKTRNLLSVLSK